jgi:two-component system, OmpR family, KDP operon response regulator KdpE
MLTSKAHILVIDDEPQIRRFLKATLSGHGYDVSEATTAAEGTKLLSLKPPELLILDLGLPDKDGLDVLRELRDWSALPVIVLSARGFEQAKVDALEAGADDYLTKPFGAAELLARIKVALRHARQGSASSSDTFKTGGLVVSLEKRVVTVDDVEIHLTPTEYKLLASLVQNAGRVVTHGQLLREVWGKRSSEQGHYLRVYMQHLRQKLGDDALNPRFIITETGIGYRLREEVAK